MPNTAFKTLLLFALTLANTSFAQMAKVEAITQSIYINDSLSKHLDTTIVYYSQGRGGTAVPTIQPEPYPFLYDSLVNIDPKKDDVRFRTYDSKNNIIADGYHNAYSGSKYVYFYNATNSIKRKLYQVLNVNNKEWVDSQMDTFMYNSNGNLTSSISYYWDTNLTFWQLTSLVRHTYYNQLLSETNYYTWDNLNSTLKHSGKTKFFYNSSNKLDSTHQYSNNGATLFLRVKNYYSYSSATETTIETYVFTTSTNAYRKSSKTINTYNTTGDLLTEESITINLHNNTTWKLGGPKTIYHYNSISKNIDYTISQRYDDNTNTHINKSRDRYVHNNQNLFTHKLQDTWNYNSNIWEPIRTSQTTTMFHYTVFNIPTAIQNKSNNNIHLKLFPNPTNGLITASISLEKEDDIVIAIYNQKGHLVRQFEKNATKQYNKQITLGGLPSGNYILEVRNEQSRTVKQFSIQ